MDIFWAWKRYREYLRGRRLSYPRLIVFIITLTAGFYGYRWAHRYLAAREAAKPIRCAFHQEIPRVEFIEDTEEIINTAVCPSALEPEVLWGALTDFRALAKEPYRASSVEYARYLTSSTDLEAVASRLPEDVRRDRDLSGVNLDAPETTYIYEEHDQIGLIFFWTVVAYQTRFVNEAERVYELNFEQPDGLGNLEFYRGRFRLEPNPEGPGTRITFVLRQAMSEQLSGQGLLGMASRMIVIGGYLKGFHPFMEEVAGLEQLARDRAPAQASLRPSEGR
ncbi:MAG: hypothetical protein ACE5KY_03050 [Candidatus Tectimicrobiota bacterium]